jgi:AraC family transcriptional activator of pobA
MPAANAQKLLVVPFREVRHFRPDDCLHCEPIQLRAAQYGWTIPAHRHAGLHQFQLLTEGGMTATLDGAHQVLKAPHALMIAPGVVHGFVYETGSQGCQVSIPSTVLAALSTHSPAMATRLSQSISIDLLSLDVQRQDCFRLFDMLGDEFACQHDGRADALNAHAILLALWFLRHLRSHHGGTRRPVLRDTLVQRFHGLIERHFLEHRPLGFYAGALGVTADHLSRVCRSVFRTSALDMVHERVALEARRMLTHTDLTVADIAIQLGFSDAAYFSRFFKVVAGTSPSDYRSLLALGLAPVPVRASGSSSVPPSALHAVVSPLQPGGRGEDQG